MTGPSSVPRGERASTPAKPALGAETTQLRDQYAAALHGVVRRLNTTSESSYTNGNSTIWQEQADAVMAVRDQQLEHLRAQVEQARALHQPTEGLGYNSDEPGSPYGYIAQACKTCGRAEEYAVRWPCPTYLACTEALSVIEVAP